MELFERFAWAILGMIVYDAVKNLIKEAIRVIKVMRNKPQ
jgi:hypothetical protein